MYGCLCWNVLSLTFVFFTFLKSRFSNYKFGCSLIFAVSLFLRLIPAREFATFHTMERNIHSANTMCLLYNNECTDGEGVVMRAQCFAGGVDKTVLLELYV